MKNKMLFRLSVDMNNAVFEDKEELIRILETAISKLREGNETAKLRDINGNTVGTYTIF